MFVVPRPRMLVERVQFALWEQSAVGRRMIAEAIIRCPTAYIACIFGIRLTNVAHSSSCNVTPYLSEQTCLLNSFYGT